MKQLRVFILGLFAAALSMLGTTAHAAGTMPDLSGLTSQVDFSPAAIAIIAIAGSLAGLYVLWRGASFVLSAIKRS